MSNSNPTHQNTLTKTIPSLEKIAQFFLKEGHELLSSMIQEIAEDINNDPELNLFSEIKERVNK